MPRACFFGEQLRFPHECGNSDVSPTHPSPPRRAIPNVHMQKIPLIHANASRSKLRHLERKLIHSLQRKARQADIGSLPRKVFAVRHSADLLIVSRAPVTRMHDHRHASERAQGLQTVQQVRINLQTSTATTTQFFS